MSPRILACAILMLGFTGIPLHAAEDPGWKGAVDLGYTAIAGNSQSQSMISSARAEKTSGKLTHHLEGSAKNTENTGKRTAEAYRAAAKEDFAMSTNDYLFIHSAWSKDRFSGYDWQLSAAAGYGRKLINEPTRKLSIEGGPGYRHDDLPLGTEDSALLRLAASLTQQLNDSVSFRQQLDAELSENNDVTHSLSELTVKMSERLALKAALDIKRNSEPPAGTKNTDRTTTLAVAWSF